jgi:hypothetical protein
MKEAPRAFTIEEVATLIQGVLNKEPFDSVAEKIHRPPARTLGIMGFYRRWVKTGKVYSGHDHLAELFIEYHKAHNMPIPTSLSAIMPAATESKSRDPQIELEILCKNFVTQVLILSERISKEKLASEFTNAFTKFQKKLETT